MPYATTSTGTYNNRISYVTSPGVTSLNYNDWIDSVTWTDTGPRIDTSYDDSKFKYEPEYKPPENFEDNKELDDYLNSFKKD